jgi:dTDP-4-dehydrorhamnose reductase
MRVMVLGANGQVGRALLEAPLPEGTVIQGFGHAEADVTDPACLRAAMAAMAPHVVINAAAYTAVDAAEDDRDQAFRVNALGAGHVAEACRAARAALLHVSTDYVFDGEASSPYLETAPVNPPNVYGASKAEGERLIRETLDRHVIVRTSWVFGHHGKNFVKSILGLLGQREAIQVINDQQGCPTAASDLATALLTLAARQGSDLAWGTYHFCGAEPISWYGFAQAIAQISRRRRPDQTRIGATSTAAYGQKARRPSYSVLDCGKARDGLGLDIPNWRQGLDQVVTEWENGR